MDTPTGHAVETLTGLGGTGVDVMFAHVVGHPLQSHRMIPLLQATTDETTQSFYQDDLDLTSADENSTPEDFTTPNAENHPGGCLATLYPKALWQGQHGFSIYARVAWHINVISFLIFPILPTPDKKGTVPKNGELKQWNPLLTEFTDEQSWLWLMTTVRLAKIYC